MSQLKSKSQDFFTNWKILATQWDDTKSKWKDSVGDFFEKKYWKELESEIKVFLKLLEDVQFAIDNSEEKIDYYD
jgi:hypothetical protein